MSAADQGPRLAAGRQRAGPWGRLLAVASLTVLWVFLWGDLSWANVAGGMLVSLFAITVFPLTPLDLRGRLHPWGIVRFAVHFVRDLVVSSVQVAIAALLPRQRLHNAIIAVPLRIVSDLNIALTSVAVTLVPGSVVMDARRETGVLYVHMLNVRDEAHLARLRRGVLDVEWRLVHAIGSPTEIRRIEWLQRLSTRVDHSGAPGDGRQE